MTDKAAVRAVRGEFRDEMVNKRSPEAVRDSPSKVVFSEPHRSASQPPRGEDTISTAA